MKLSSIVLYLKSSIASVLILFFKVAYADSYMNIANYPYDGYDYGGATFAEGHFGSKDNDCFVIQSITRRASLSLQTLPDAPVLIICRSKDGAYSEVSNKLIGEVLYVNGNYPTVTDLNNDGLDDIFLLRSWDGDFATYIYYSLVSRPDGTYRINRNSINNPYKLTLNLQNDPLDYDGDGCMDIYNAHQILFKGDCNGGFITTTPDDSGIKGSYPWIYGTGICSGDFLGVGSKQVVITDGTESVMPINPNVIISINRSGQLTAAAPLPVPYYNKIYNAAAAHNFSCRVSDINNDGKLDIFIFTRPWSSFTNNIWVDQSYIQLYLNKGNGSFQDISATAFPAYNKNSNGSYSSILRDVNKDGFVDLIVEGPDYEGITSFSNQIWINNGDNSFKPLFKDELNNMAVADAKSLHGGINTLTRLSMLPFLKSNGPDYLTLIEDSAGKYHIDVIQPSQILINSGGVKTLFINNLGNGNISSSPTGINCGSTCSFSFDQDSSVSLMATPDSGYIFTGWSGACSGTDGCTVIMKSNQSVSGSFSPIPIFKNLTVTNVGLGSVLSSPSGINCGSTCNSFYPINSSVTLSATATPGYVFSGWSGSCFGTGACTVSMSSDKSVTATFIKSPKFTLSASVAGKGTIADISGQGINCGSTCSFSYQINTPVTLVALPQAGNTFTGWGGACSGTGSCTLVMGSDQTITATFVSSGKIYNKIFPALNLLLQ